MFNLCESLGGLLKRMQSRYFQLELSLRISPRSKVSLGMAALERRQILFDRAKEAFIMTTNNGNFHFVVPLPSMLSRKSGSGNTERSGIAHSGVRSVNDSKPV